jgi:peptide/nickel transport system permease protein
MALYALKRLGLAFIVLVIVLAGLGAFDHIVPGDPAHAMLGPRVTPQLLHQVRVQMGLNESVPTQVWNFIINAFHGNLGTDFVTQRPVLTFIGQNLPDTLILTVTSLLVAVLGALPLAIYSATHPDSRIDRMLSGFTISILTIPPYVAALFLLLIFTVWLAWLPALGSGSLSDPVGYAEHLILPALALAISWLGYIARLLRASLLSVLSADYIRTARAYGIPQRRINYRYALKNALAPTVAICGVAFGNLMGSAVFVEIIFGRAGMGTMVYNAITERNYPIVRGGVLLFAVFFMLANFLADLCYRALDPRIESYGGQV